ncbi:hypothetical protein HK104_000266 [Borealophlyctis nickersoniae]|nr:hypothetical protein HK104_000266 [Borealophlyctis nickersoniae]
MPTLNCQAALQYALDMSKTRPRAQAAEKAEMEKELAKAVWKDCVQFTPEEKEAGVKIARPKKGKKPAAKGPVQGGEEGGEGETGFQVRLAPELGAMRGRRLYRGDIAAAVLAEEAAPVRPEWALPEQWPTMSISSRLIWANVEPALIDEKRDTIIPVPIRIDEIQLEKDDNIVRQTKEFGVEQMREQLEKWGIDTQIPITVRNCWDEPFVVADEAGHNNLEVIEGRHRVTACKRAGIKLLTGVVVKKDTDKLKLILIGSGQNLSHEDTVHMSLGDYLEAIRGIHNYHQAVNPNKDNYINCKNLGVKHLLFKEFQGKKKGVVAGAEEQTVEKQPKKTKGTKGKGHISKSAYGHYHKLANVPQEAFDLIVEDQALPEEEQAFTYESMYVNGKSCKFCGFSGEADPDAWLTYLNMLVDHSEEHQRPATGPEAQYILVTLGWRETVVDEVLPELVLEDGEKLGDNEEELERFTELVWDGK